MTHFWVQTPVLFCHISHSLLYAPGVLCGNQVERELSLVDKTVEKTSFQLQYSRSLGRDGRLPADVEQYSGPPPPAPGHTTLSLTRAGRLASSRSSEALAVSSC